MSILDAMGYGLPVVSTNVGGITKIVHDEGNGFCCEPGDIESFAEAIEQVLLTSNTEMAAKSMGIVRGEFSLETHINKLERLYESVR